MINLATLLGLLPASPFHLLGALVPILAWYATRPLAKRLHITVVHNSSLAVSYWEELLFRGVAFGVVLAISNNLIITISVSSVLFGVLHFRNLWWASWRRVVWQAVYAGVFIGSITGILRWWSGDIYLAIAAHALNNFIFIAWQRGVAVPTNEFLKSKERNMSWWQRGFFGIGLKLVNKLS